MTVPFVHLKVHSEYSVIDGLVRIKPLVQRARELGMLAVALTDQTNFFALVKFYKAALTAGVKPILGSDFLVRGEGDDARPTSVTLLAQNLEGYRNLGKLMTRAWRDGQSQGRALIERGWIASVAGGVIALSGGVEGDIGQALINGRPGDARALIGWWQALFGDRFYLELQRTGRRHEEDYLHAAVALAAECDCPVVATNAVHFLARDEFEIHETRVCIQDGRTLDDPRRPRRYSEGQYLKSGDEMGELFADIPEALENTVAIAQRCSVELTLGEYVLPDYPVPDGMTMAQFFHQLSHDGLTERLRVLLDTEAPDHAERERTYRERLDFELDTIIQMGFPGYFLIVMDFIRWAKEHDIPVGPGRGSGAGSVVAYALGITDLDPLAYDLLFERFLNPERVSMPDFDVDFCMDNRDRVIQYVAESYGREAVSQIITFGTMAAKAAVRDVARAQGKPYGLADKLAKLIPFEVGMTLDKAYEQEEPLREFLATDEPAQEIWDMAKQLEGITRTVGKHAGGVVIAPTALTDFAPLYCDEAGDSLVTQYDKNDVEDVGLVKFDFLGLRTLTIIDWAVEMINRQRSRLGEPPLGISLIPLDDAPTFELLQGAETTAVFQLESRGMKDLIKRLRPNRFEDIIALVALFRPGPLQSGMVDDFINRKHGRAQVAYPHPQYQHDCLKPILEPTYGIILYQEQVMQIAQAMGGYSLGGADLLRRAMGKKNAEEMARQRETFLAGATERGFDTDLASNIFDLMEKFAGYGFNKSHSAAYALVSYQTAWLKAHYPAEFMAATMSSDMDKTDKVVTFIEECRALDLPLTLPDINKGEYRFIVAETGSVIYGLGAIKGLGEGPIDNLIVERAAGGPFTDLFDFCARTDSRKVNKRAVEALILAGAFDRLGTDRAILMAALDDTMKAADQRSHNSAAGIVDLFGEVTPAGASNDIYVDYRHVRPWSSRQRLEGEKQTLGLYVTGHPIDDYVDEVAVLADARIADLRVDRNSQTVAGLVVNLRTMKSKRGETIAFLTLDDRSGRIEVAVFSDLFSDVRELLVKDAILVVSGAVTPDDYSGSLKMRATSVVTLAEARGRRVQAIVLTLKAAELNGDLRGELESSLVPTSADGCPVWVDYEGATAHGRIALGEQWRVEPNDDSLFRLKQQFGASRVAVVYNAC